MNVSVCTALPCRNRQGLCPVSLLCGCACHAANTAASAVSTAPSGHAFGGLHLVGPDVNLYRYPDAHGNGHIVTSNSPQPEPTAEDEALDPHELAMVLLAGALAGQGHTTTPHGDAVGLVRVLVSNGLRIVAE